MFIAVKLEMFACIKISVIFVRTIHLCAFGENFNLPMS